MIEYHHFVYFTILNELIECIFEWCTFIKVKINIFSPKRSIWFFESIDFYDIVSETISP